MPERCCKVTNLKKILVTFFGLGYAPVAPGTCGALGALVTYVVIAHVDTSGIALVILCALSIAGCVWLTPWAKKHFGSSDPKQFVLDEAAGLYLTMLFVPVKRLWAAAAIGFVLFRFFDILKPFPIKKAEKAPYNLGIVADDLVAGVFANILLRIGLHFISG